MKKCVKCNVEKNFEDFSKAKENKDGLRGTCKICLTLYQIEYHKNYTINNIERKRINNRLYNKKRRLTDSLFKLKCNIRTLIGNSIRNNNYSKKTKSFKILGCSYEHFKEYLENKFTDGMNWDNQGKWHLDHIYPVSLAKDEQHLIQLNHYTNFQPLWAVDNIKKGNKI
jgi:hypothetical protein